eukprot:Gb_24930 [translate_table: standard]
MFDDALAMQGKTDKEDIEEEEEMEEGLKENNSEMRILQGKTKKENLIAELRTSKFELHTQSRFSIKPSKSMALEKAPYYEVSENESNELDTFGQQFTENSSSRLCQLVHNIPNNGYFTRKFSCDSFATTKENNVSPSYPSEVVFDIVNDGSNYKGYNKSTDIIMYLNADSQKDTFVLDRVTTIMLEKMGTTIFAIGDGLQVVDALKYTYKLEEAKLDESRISSKKVSTIKPQESPSIASLGFDLIFMDHQVILAVNGNMGRSTISQWLKLNGVEAHEASN